MSVDDIKALQGDMTYTNETKRHSVHQITMNENTGQSGNYEAKEDLETSHNDMPNRCFGSPWLLIPRGGLGC